MSIENLVYYDIIGLVFLLILLWLNREEEFILKISHTATWVDHAYIDTCTMHDVIMQSDMCRYCKKRKPLPGKVYCNKCAGGSPGPLPPRGW